MKKIRINSLLIILSLVFILTLSVNDAFAYTWSSSNSYSSGYRSSNYYSTSNRYSSGSYSNYYSSRYSRPTTTTPDNTSAGNTSGGTTTTPDRTAPNNDTTTVLKYGMSGTAVRTIQQKLDRLGYDVGSINGYYGRQTTIAVMYFQRDNGLSINGRVDSQTKSKIEAVYNAKINAGGNTGGQQPQPSPQPTEPAPQPKPQPQPAPDQGNTGNTGQTPALSGQAAMEQQMLSLINQERTSRGLKPLQMNSTLVNLARKKSKDMIVNNYFSHTSPTYGSPFKMLNDAGFSYRTAGENIAGNSSVTAAHRALMNSAGHRKNILNPNFTKIGIGIVKGGPYGMMFTQLFAG